jgi:hypothetical protein
MKRKGEKTLNPTNDKKGLTSKHVTRKEIRIIVSIDQINRLLTNFPPLKTSIRNNKKIAISSRSFVAFIKITASLFMRPENI